MHNNLPQANGTPIGTAEHLLDVYSVRLQSAIAQRDAEAAAAVETAMQELNPALKGLDLMTFEGWCSAAVALLADKAIGTALVDESFNGYLLLVDGSLHALAMRDDGEARFASEWGIPIDAVAVDRSSWDGVRQCWEAHDPLLARECLLRPAFATLAFDEISE
ncbi:hypothetical protein [Paracidovorax citrulli]|uniref:hypothetical protein n=1 Tax=Paracidovorax citrulli TaxID=80869 RepID=UPI003FA6965E